MNYAWPTAFAVVGFFAAISCAVIFAPRSKDAQVACIEQRGKWVGSGWGMQHGTCDFPTATSTAK